METNGEAKKMKMYETPRVGQNQYDVDTDVKIGHTDEETYQTAQNRPIHNGHSFQQHNSQVQAQGSVELQDQSTGTHRANHEGAGLNQRGNQIQLNKLKKGQTVNYLHQGDHYTAEISSRAGKVTGIYSSSHNTEYRSPDHTGQVIYIHWSKSKRKPNPIKQTEERTDC